jgi:hypothetical protein
MKQQDGSLITWKSQFSITPVSSLTKVNLKYSQTSIYVFLSLRTFYLRTIFFKRITQYTYSKFDLRTSFYVLKFDIRTLSTLSKVRISNLST